MPYFKAIKQNEDGKPTNSLYIYADSLSMAEQALVDRGVAGYSDFKYYSESREGVPDNARCIGSPEQHPTYVSPVFEQSGQVIQFIVIIALGVGLGMLGYTLVSLLLGWLLGGVFQ